MSIVTNERFEGALVSAACVVMIACGSTYAGRSDTSVESAVELVARQVLRKTIFESATEIPICVEDQSAPIAINVLVQRLSIVDRRIRPCHGVYRHPVYVYIRSVERNDSGLAIHAGYYCGNLCADDSIYIVARRSNHWEIVSVIPNWVS